MKVLEGDTLLQCLFTDISVTVNVTKAIGNEYFWKWRYSVIN